MSARREFPILFSGPMVRAIMRQRDPKTQTRRLAQLRRPDMGGVEHAMSVGPEADPAQGWGRVHPGDRLWVRETLRRDGAIGLDGRLEERWRYAADDAEVTLPRDDQRVPAMLSWAHHKKDSTCVSIHMPRWACRNVLEVTARRAEQLQDITEHDVIAEGVDIRRIEFRDDARTQILAGFANLWDMINGDRAPWASNPLVWAISFRRVTV